MSRFLVFVIVVGGIGFIMYATKPTPADYLDKLQERADLIEGDGQQAFAMVRSADPVDEMLTAHPPSTLIDQTQHNDYYVVSVFTTEYQAPGYPSRRVRTYGLFSTLISRRLR